MRSSSSSSGFDIREAVDSIRDAFSPRAGARSGAGWPGPKNSAYSLRDSILRVLAEESRTGHKIMIAIGAQGDRTTMPTASALYPLLQQLTDEGLLATNFDGERIVYSLTDAGREAASAAATTAPDAQHENEGKGDWSDRMSGRWNDHWNERTAAVPRAGAKLAQAAAQVTHSGTREQQERAAALLDQTRKALYAILAED